MHLHGCGGASLTERPAPSIFGPSIASPSSQRWVAISWQNRKMRIRAPLVYDATLARLEVAKGVCALRAAYSTRIPLRGHCDFQSPPVLRHLSPPLTATPRLPYTPRTLLPIDGAHANANFRAHRKLHLALDWKISRQRWLVEGRCARIAVAEAAGKLRPLGGAILNEGASESLPMPRLGWSKDPRRAVECFITNFSLTLRLFPLDRAMPYSKAPLSHLSPIPLKILTLI
ncbi:hypothetical protein SCHPADRAFT_8395 [Schizopora paradoxa]|uniref:Uncharacterized protein n=1 Tax=Schizopora paradoxa TaxID=27342 RepID=A0A0H2STP2_9AGAM|nr:hypothetical protein SCHPADRAFT_8395 [Schizopora paradoxa]